MNAVDNLWSATLEEIKRGYRFDAEQEAFTCLICGASFTEGRIYNYDGELYAAEKGVRAHIEKEHGSVFQFLLGLDKKYTGLTELQKNLLGFFYQGLNDQEIVAATGTGSSSTIRNHRHTLRERAKQAKVFLAIMELVDEQLSSRERPTALARSAAGYEQKVLATYFREGVHGPLRSLPHHGRKKAIVLEQLAKRFEPGRHYAEPEVNALLSAVHPDYVTLRRELIDYGFLDRERDGSRYWVKPASSATAQHPQASSPAGRQPEHNRAGVVPVPHAEARPTSRRAKEGTRLDRKMIKYEYKQTPRPMGVVRILNTANGKALVVGSLNLNGTINRHRLQLEQGLHSNRELQQDWQKYGPERFTFEVLEKLKPSEDSEHDYRDEVKALEQKWREQLQELY